jgi:hypothetical protein
MNWHDGNDKREPSPELLAAYAAGALDRDPALASVKQELEAWLAGHPEARAEADAHRRLHELWQQTTPVEPDAAAWAAVSARIQSARPRGARLPRGWIAAISGITAAAIWLLLTLLSSGPDRPERRQAPVAAEQAFAVATSEEIEILSVEGEDTHTLVVGDLPVRGPLELLGPGEVDVTSVAPAARDNMRPEVRAAPAAPMIWAILDSER